MVRDSFTNKYSDLPQRWDIKNDIVYYIIRRYEKMLSEEIEKLKTVGIKLPKYFKDRRTDEEYIYDIIDGWVMEDLICDAWLRPKLLEINKDVKINIMGTNRDRVIQKYDPKKITTKPDFIFSLNNNSTGIELQMARNELANGYDMKQTKVGRAKDEGSYFLWIIIPKNHFFLINTSEDMKDIRPTPNPYWGGKMVYHISQDFIKNIGGYFGMKDRFNELIIKKLKLK